MSPLRSSARVTVCLLAGLAVLCSSIAIAQDAPARLVKSLPDPGGFWRKKVSLSASEMPLKSAIDDIARSAQVKVEWDLDALKQLGFDVEQPVTLTIEQETFDGAFQKLLRWNRATGWQQVWHRFRRGVLTVTTYAADRQQTRQALPEWMRTFYDTGKITVSVDDDDHVRSLMVTNILTDDLLSHIATLPQLRYLEIHGKVACTPDGAAPLAGLSSLERLGLFFGSQRGDDLADAILKSVAGLKSLKEIRLNETGVTDAGVRQLESLPQLTTLKLCEEGRLTDASLSSIANLNHLKSLELTSHVGTDLGRMRFSEQAFQALSDLQDVEHLHVSGHSIAPEMLTFPRLKRLEISGPLLDKSLTSRMAACRELEFLDLYFLKVTDDALEPFAGHPKLGRLNLRTRDITDAGLSPLKYCPELSEVRLETHGLTDKVFAHLAELKSLTNLNVNWQKNRFTLEGVKQLANLPKLDALRLRIIPFSGGKLSVIQYSIIPASRRLFDKSDPLIPQDKPKLPNFDVNSMAEIFPNTAVHLEMDDFDPFDK